MIIPAHPKAFLFGLSTGFILCMFLGRRMAQKGYYKNFERVSGSYQIDNTWVITASQVKKHITNNASPEDIIVLVGGSSVLMGAGQPIRHLWSKELQRKLGEKYKVFNLAGPAGVLNGFAGTAYLMLRQNYKNIYLISDMTENVVALNPDGIESQKHLFWDAYEKNLIEGGIEAEFLKGNDERDRKKTEFITKIKMGCKLDRYLYFNDLWTYFHFYFFTPYYFHHAGHFQWKARKDWVDYDYEVNMESLKKLSQYAEKFESESFLNMVKRISTLDAYFKKENEKWVFNEKILEEKLAQIKRNIICPRKVRTILAYVGISPYYLNYAQDEIKKGFKVIYEKQKTLYEENQFFVVRPEFGPEDFNDLVHLNTLGGLKLAHAIGEKIKNLEGEKN